MVVVIPVISRRVAAVSGAFGVSMVDAAPSLSAQESWRAEPPMHYARAAHVAVDDGNVIYALAGTGVGGVPVLVIERFDGKTWRDEGTIPGPGLNAPATVVLTERFI